MSKPQITPEQFCYWLQGFCEPRENDVVPTKAQWKMIRMHLEQVFEKVTAEPRPRTPGTYCAPKRLCSPPKMEMGEIHGSTDPNMILIC